MAEVRIEQDAVTGYASRTVTNAREADFTVAFGVDAGSRGSRLTKRAAGDGFFWIDITSDALESARKLYVLLRRHKAKHLNVAGNSLHTVCRISRNPISQPDFNLYVHAVLSPIHTHHGLTMIRSGGQTGADLAGSVAGYALGIPVTVFMPKGYRQRDSRGRDHDSTERMVMNQIKNGAEGIGIF